MTSKASCLMATHGRYAHVCRAVAMFLAQDYADKELLILNAHPVPLNIDSALVRIYNEPDHPTLGHCRQRLLELATGSVINTYDDDDLHLPWKLSQGMSHLDANPTADGWKPARSWFTNGGARFELAGNAMESSIFYRADAVRRIGYRLSMGDEHAPLLSSLHVAETELGHWAGYGYTWGLGGWHASGSLGSNQSLEERTRIWKEHDQDTGPADGWIVPNYATMHQWWRHMAPFVPEADRAAWLARALG